MIFQKIEREFYNRNTIEVAQQLLGQYLIHLVDDIPKVGKIVEVEAYLGPHDLACHSAKGLTNRTKIMFGPAGYAYLYLIYGKYYCMNVVTGGEGAAVLIRAVEPLLNIAHRTQGPGLLCQAMQLDKQLNGHDLTSDNFYLAYGQSSLNSGFEIVARPRIGVHYAKEWAEKLLRFYIKNNPYVSKR